VDTERGVEQKGEVVSTFIRILIGLFLIAHGIVHPLLAIIPEPGTESTTIGEFWTRSWLLGEGRGVKIAIYVLSGLAALVFLLAGLSFMGIIVPQAWWRTLWLAGAAFSLVLLIVFWHKDWQYGVAIDVALLILPFVVTLNPA
jgi:hypothetical protein